MTKKTTHAIKAAQAAKQPTAAELAEARKRQLMQKLYSLTEATYIALAGNPAYADKTPAEIEQRATSLAERLMGSLYGLQRKEDAKAEKKCFTSA